MGAYLIQSSHCAVRFLHLIGAYIAMEIFFESVEIILT